MYCKFCLFHGKFCSLFLPREILVQMTFLIVSSTSMATCMQIQSSSELFGGEHDIALRNVLAGWLQIPESIMVSDVR